VLTFDDKLNNVCVDRNTKQNVLFMPLKGPIAKPHHMDLAWI